MGGPHNGPSKTGPRCHTVIKNTLRNAAFDSQPPMLRIVSAIVFCASREDRESWIRAKYEQKLFVAPLPPPTPGEGPDITLSGRLLLAVMEHNLPKLLLLLAHCTKEDINGPLSRALSSRSLFALRLPGSALHAACQQGNVVMTQLLLWVREIFQRHNAHTKEGWNTNKYPFLNSFKCLENMHQLLVNWSWKCIG